MCLNRSKKLAVKLLIQSYCTRIGANVELLAEDARATIVLTNGPCNLSRGRIAAHEAAMRLFTERVRLQNILEVLSRVLAVT